MPRPAAKVVVLAAVLAVTAAVAVLAVLEAVLVAAAVLEWAGCPASATTSTHCLAGAALTNTASTWSHT